MIKDLKQLIEAAQTGEKMVLAVAAAEDAHVLEAVEEARDLGIIEAKLVGDLDAISVVAEELDIDLSTYDVYEAESLEEAAQKAVKLVREGKADFLMKGLIDTSILMKAVLDKDNGLRTSSLLSHVMIYEVPTYHKLLLLSDGGMNIAPTLEQKKQIVDNGVIVGSALGIEPVKVACLAAKEKVSEKMQATVDAAALAETFSGAEDRIVEGPLAFDLAVSKEAAETKGFKSQIAGDVDFLLVPTIEMGNGIGKSLTYMANAESAGIVMGAKAPIVLVSRADSASAKLYSIALGRMIAAHKEG